MFPITGHCAQTDVHLAGELIKTTNGGSNKKEFEYFYLYLSFAQYFCQKFCYHCSSSTFSQDLMNDRIN